MSQPMIPWVTGGAIFWCLVEIFDVELNFLKLELKFLMLNWNFSMLYLMLIWIITWIEEEECGKNLQILKTNLLLEYVSLTIVTCDLSHYKEAVNYN